MKITTGGAPIYVSRRKIGGVEIIQGTSRVKLAEAEAAQLIRALTDISANDAYGQEKMNTIEHQR